jgi:hypothetical protein
VTRGRALVVAGFALGAAAGGAVATSRLRARGALDERLAPVGPGPRRRLDRDVARLGLLTPSPPGPLPPVTSADLADLPEPARRWLRWAGVVGRPPARALRVRMRGRIRGAPGEPWMPFTAWQYNTVEPMTRTFRMTLRAGGVVPAFGVDSYLDGRGRMLGRLLGVVTVADGSGPEFDLGELATWVNDAALLAPSMLLGPHTTWEDAGPDEVAVAVADRGNVVRACITVDPGGPPVGFTTDDRWYAGTDPPTRATWRTPLPGWTTTPDGRPVPVATSAVWALPDGDFTYVEGTFDPATLELDPGAPAVRR